MPRPPKFVAMLLLALVFVSQLALAQTAPASPPTAAGEKAAEAKPTEVKETTEVQGTPPGGLVGRWLVVAQIKIPDGTVRPIGRTWEIRRGPEHLEFVLHRSQLPTKVNDKLTAAGAAGKAWTPDPEDLREVDETWGKLPPMQLPYTLLEHKIIASDAFPPEFENDDVTKGARLVFNVRETFAGQAVARTTSVYGVREHTPTTLSGTFITTSLAMAMMPIPITLKGDFQAYRIGEPPTCSWFQRLFSGCD